MGEGVINLAKNYNSLGNLQKTLTGEYEILMIGRDTFLVLDLKLDVMDGVRGLNLQSDGHSGQGFHVDPHVVVAHCSAVLKLLSWKNNTVNRMEE